jgi:diguanylate cyclase (GGDEF)-like protein
MDCCGPRVFPVSMGGNCDFAFFDLSIFACPALATLERIGGEEFTVLVPSVTLPEACAVAERIRATVAMLRIDTTTGDAIGVTVSLGVSNLAPSDPQGKILLDRADAALYEAKRGGRNRWAH